MEISNKTKVLMVSHFTFKDEEEGAVFPQSIRDYLIKRVGRLTYIDHPFPTSNFPSSQMRIYKKRKKIYQLTTARLKMQNVILFVYQLFLTIFFIFRKPGKYDLCIACDNLSLISVVLFRKLGIIKRLIYYTVDYTSERYKNQFLNGLYHYMDRVASMISDVNWVAVENIKEAKVQNGLELKKCAFFQVVPMGFSRESISIKPSKEVNRFNLVFVGILIEKQGLQLVINVLNKLVKKYPEICLKIIGSGPFESKINELVKQNKVASHVEFTGYIKNHTELIRLLRDGGIGLATYVPSIGDYTYNADPSKIKLYLLCGLPVITTKVPPIAKEISKRNAGFVINYSEHDLIKSLEALFMNKNRYIRCRENAIKMSKAFDIDLILKKAFKKLQ